MKIALPLILLLATAVWTDAETSVILQQTNSPIQILRYTNHAYGLGDRITHSITFTNTSRARVTRIQFGFASFDAFNSYMGSLIGWEGMAETNSQSDDSFNQRNDQVIRFEEVQNRGWRTLKPFALMMARYGGQTWELFCLNYRNLKRI